MKIAICFSGQPRELNKSLPYFKENIFNCNMNEQLDIFCHYWFDDHLIGKEYSTSHINNPSLGVWSKNTNLLINELKPIYSKQDTPKDFNQFKHFKSYRSKPEQIASQYYSIYQSNKLKTQYERENNFMYDIVVRMRYDMIPVEPLIFNRFVDEIKKSYLIVPAEYQYMRRGFFFGGITLLDQFAMGNSLLMNYYSELFNNYENLYQQIIKTNDQLLSSESYLGMHMRKNMNVQIFESDHIILKFARDVFI